MEEGEGLVSHTEEQAVGNLYSFLWEAKNLNFFSLALFLKIMACRRGRLRHLGQLGVWQMVQEEIGEALNLGSGSGEGKRGVNK